MKTITGVPTHAERCNSPTPLSGDCSRACRHFDLFSIHGDVTDGNGVCAPTKRNLGSPLAPMNQLPPESRMPSLEQQGHPHGLVAHSSPTQLTSANGNGLVGFASGGEESDEEQGLLQVIRIAWERKAWVAVGIALATVLGVVYYLRATPIYRSTSEILVVNKTPEAVTEDGVHLSPFDDYMSTHRALISSPVVVRRAIEESELESLPAFAKLPSMADRVATIIDGLSVSGGSRISGRGADNILTLSYRGPDPYDCVHVVNAIVASYQSYLEEKYDDMSQDAVTLISEARDSLEKDLKEQDAAYRAFREQAPLIADLDESENPAATRLAMIQSQQAELMLRRTELQTQLTSLRKALENPDDDVYLAELVSKWDRTVRDSVSQERLADKELANERPDVLLSLLIEEERLGTRVGQNHPRIVSLRREIEETRGFFATPQEAQTEENRRLVRSYERFLEQEVARLKSLEEQYAGFYQEEYRAAKDLELYRLRANEFQRGYTRTQQLYDGVIEQLQEASIVKDYGGFRADIIAPPQLGLKVEPSAFRCLGTSGAFGLLFGAFLAYVANSADKSFRTPSEIRTRLGLPVFGHIPRFVADSPKNGDTDSALDPRLCTVHKPSSVAAEAYRELRTALFFSNRGHASKVVQVTSPNPGDGKSTLAANLSISIAQSGKRTLLIDADLRRPTQHKIFGIEASSGLGSVIAQDDELRDSLVATEIANLWLLPSGPLPNDPSELLTSPRFSELIAVVREQFDYVLVDSGPVLLISDPRVVTPRVDAVLLALRMSRRVRRDAVQAQEILSSVGAASLGVVVNGLGDARSRQYRYGGRYGYQYGSDSYAGYHGQGSEPRANAAVPAAEVSGR